MNEWIDSLLGTRLFHIGNSQITVWTVVQIVVLTVILYVVAGLVRRWVAGSMLKKRGIDVGIRDAMGSLIRYVVLALGFLLIVQSAGIDLSSLFLVGGAVGIGIGLGFQRIANDIVSGLILLIGRPVKVGDRVEIAQVVGDVSTIGLRATTVITNDNIAIIVPNTEFTANAVTNWTFTDRDVRFHVAVGVSYAADPEVVRALLLEVAAEHPGVLKKPEPDVIFLGFGESALNFDLRVWTDSYITRPAVLQSDLYFVIWKKLKANNIEIPFPQRDVHLHKGSNWAELK